MDEKTLVIDWRSHKGELSDDDAFKLSLGYYKKLHIKFIAGFTRLGLAKLRSIKIAKEVSDTDSLNLVAQMFCMPTTIELHKEMLKSTKQGNKVVSRKKSMVYEYENEAEGFYYCSRVHEYMNKKDIISVDTAKHFPWHNKI